MLAKSGYSKKDGRRENVFGGTLEEHRIEKITFMPTTTIPEKVIDSLYFDKTSIELIQKRHERDIDGENRNTKTMLIINVVYDK